MIDNLKFSLQNQPNINEHCFRAIYLITNTVNQKIYVGSSENFRRRFRTYLNCEGHSRNATVAIYFAIRKYGFQYFEFQILELVGDKEDIIEREQYWIDKLQPFDDRGYNLCYKAGLNCRLGTKHTQEAKEKMSRAATGRRLSRRWRANLRKAARSSERRKQVSLSQSEPVLQIDTKTLQVIHRFDSLSKAGEAMNINSTDIGKACSGRSKTAGGFFWCKESVYKERGFTPRPSKKHGTFGYIFIKPILQFDKDGSFIRQWDSCTDAGLSLDKKTPNKISACCRGERKSAYGYKWQWVTDENVIKEVKERRRAWEELNHA